MHPDPHPPAHAVVDAVARALAEDLTPLGDVSAALVPADCTARASVVAREPGVLAGTRCATETFRQVDDAIAIDWLADDGSPVDPGSVLAELSGPLRSMLTGERTALNFLGHLSGIATLTRRFVDAAGPQTTVWDTRKTTPGLRSLEKAAVRAGGGANHRGNLSEWVMLKDNHLVAVRIGAAVEQAKSAWPGRTVQVECDTFDQFVEALHAGADAVLLDNMDPEEVLRCVKELEGTEGRRPWVEASGGITLDNVADYAATGVDLVSTSVITSSAPVLDLGLDLTEVRRGE